MAKQLLLIDGDQFLYRACTAVEHEVRWDDENHVLVANEAEAWDALTGALRLIFDHFGHKDHIVALGAGRCFRYDVDPQYKAKRVNLRKPVCYAAVRQRLIDEYKVITQEGLEADDVLGLLATKPGKHDRIIVARDKDLKTIPGKLWDGRAFLNIPEHEADYWHLYQTLVGDTADGYRGCPGIGPKKAEALLGGVPTNGVAWATPVLWERVLEAFEKAGLTADDALRNARLARILRWSDWDQHKKEPILWEPKTLA